MILRIEKDLVFVKNNLGETPLYVAAASGEKDVFDILARDFSEVTMKRNDGKTVLHATVIHDCYYLATNIVNQYPQIVNERDDEKMTALDVLATKQLSFKSGSDYLFAEIGKTPSVPFQIIETIIYSCIPPMYKESKPSDNSSRTQATNKVDRIERPSFINYLLGFSWLQVIDEAKQNHILAPILAKMLLENYDWSYIDPVPNPLIQASKLKINELVVEILQKYPEAVETLDEQRNILHIAAEHKNRFLFEYLLKRVAHKERMLADIDEQGNTILHYAANVGSPFRTSTGDHFEEIWCVLSVFMMMWGVLWFKHVKNHMHPRLWDVKNSEGITAEEVFERNHLHVRKEAEDAIRNLANSALMLAILLCTVNFAAIFTVPGGFDQKTGLPILLKKVKHELWMLIFYLGAALLNSVVTIGTLLSFVLCKFHSDDFYISLPTRIVIAMVSVFYATTFSVLACVQTLNLDYIFLNKDVWWLIIAMVVVGFIMTLIYIDLAFPIFDYLYYLISYSFISNKRGPM
ncbi:ankyrin repeat-containing protein NPR4-like [Lycium ferocissimum]|uniref:ankyrin repeat-containing protein NPR4-like n=1 Tax=Lycium ferocissimum TaxID=112874 RepID=UPI00281579A4|nr:ankyrin repeat-containing protein NPR4-like [Lycium ferocissimum]